MGVLLLAAWLLAGRLAWLWRRPPPAAATAATTVQYYSGTLYSCSRNYCHLLQRRLQSCTAATAGVSTQTYYVGFYT